MYAVHGPVAHPGGAQRATVTAAVAQDAQRVAQAVAVLPSSLEDLLVVVRMLLVQAVGDEADALTAAGPCGHRLIHPGIRDTCRRAAARTDAFFPARTWLSNREHLLHGSKPGQAAITLTDQDRAGRVATQTISLN